MKNLSHSQRIYVPLDNVDLEQSQRLSLMLKDQIGGVKIGKEFFTKFGPEGVTKIRNLGVPIFLDLKFHDIPNTVAGAIRSAISLEPSILNVHAQGGRDMLLASRDAIDNEIDKLGCKPPLLFGVTVLTSMNKSDLRETGVADSVLEQVKRLTLLCAETGLDGVVCSANEIKIVREVGGEDFKIITPGIRPAWSERGDQKRIVTPAEAIKRGGDFLVIGRPITQSQDPANSTRKIIGEIQRELG